MKTAKEWAELYDSDEFKSQYYYNGNDLGVRCMVGLTTIKLWSPVAEAVTINFYKDGEPTTRPYWTSPMRQGSCGIWEWSIHESLHKTYYDFTVTIDGVDQRTGDPYAKAAGVNGGRSMVVDLNETDPVDWASDRAPALASEQFIDEIHVKEFSWDPSGGWPADVRGKYRALAMADTTLDGDGQTPTGLAFLKDMGITHVQLMPIYDYGSVDESRADDQFNWGYDPINYNVPEGSYSTDPHHGEVRIRELKEAIQSLHTQGFRVIMDVVYNHTWNLDNPLQRTVPYYYYRTWPDSGNLSNGSGCGNDIASERPMVAKYIIDSVMYWTREYHLDGFRFDLMGLMTVELMNDIQQQLDAKYGVGEKLVYGEPWSADKTAAPADTPLANKDNFGLVNDHIGLFCDDTRDTIKGSAGDIYATGFVNGAEGLEGKIINSVSAWRNNPGIHSAWQVINYVSAHDNQTLWDKLSETTPYEDLRRQQYRLAAAIYLTCQGRPFMLSGESFCRTKGGNTNSHDAPIEINRLDWQQVTSEADMVNYYRGLIALRRQLPGLCDKSPLANTRIGNTWAQPGLVGYMVDNTDDAGSSHWEYLCIVYNRNSEAHDIELDDGEWEVLATSKDSWLWQHPEVVTSKVTVGPVDWIMLGQPVAATDDSGTDDTGRADDDDAVNENKESVEGHIDSR